MKLIPTRGKIFASLIASLGLALASAHAQSNPPSQNYPAYPITTTSTDATAQSSSASAQKSSTSASASAATQPSSQDQNAANNSGPGSQFTSNLYTVDKTLLSSTQVGGQYQYQLTVKALQNITHVHVTEHLPAGLSFVSADPQTTVSGNDLTWMLPSMNKGDEQKVTVTVIPTAEGNYLTTTMVCVDPNVTLPLFAGLPKLELTKTGPAAAEVGQPIAYVITVRNSGTATAHNVQVADVLPAGMTSSDTLTTTIGDLAPGQSRTLNVTAQAGDKGQFTNTATATYAGGQPVQAQSVVNAAHSHLTITKTGPANQFIRTQATYAITVNNDGDTALSNVTVTDSIPSGTKVVSATGGDIGGSTVTWTIASIAPGQSVSNQITLTAAEPMTATNKASVAATSATGLKLNGQAQAVTDWNGAPGLTTSIRDTKDPIGVGDTTVYVISVTNQGSFKPVNARITVTLTDNMKPTGAEGDIAGTVAGQVVDFGNVVLKPHSTINLRVPAQAVKSGVAIARLAFMSSYLSAPLTQEESTFVY